MKPQLNQDLQLLHDLMDEMTRSIEKYVNIIINIKLVEPTIRDEEVIRIQLMPNPTTTSNARTNHNINDGFKNIIEDIEAFSSKIRISWTK